MNETEHRNNLDLLRLLAALQVCTVHSIEWLRVPAPSWLIEALGKFPGVPIFFVISGFVITNSLMRNGDLTRYARNRAVRIYPALWVNLLVIFTELLLLGSLLPVHLLTSSNIVHFITLALTASTYAAWHIAPTPFFWGDGGLSPFFPGGVLWSIVVEIGFYCIAPILLLSRKPWLAIGLGGIASICTAFGQNIWQSPLLDTIIAPYLWIFLLGAASRLAWPKLQRCFAGKFPFWLALHVLVPAADYKILSLDSMVFVLTLAGCVISFGYTIPGTAKRLLRGQDISYGIYLYHMVVITTMMALGYTPSWWLWLLSTSLTILMATMSWILVERPAMSLKPRPPKIDNSDDATNAYLRSAA